MSLIIYLLLLLVLPLVIIQYISSWERDGYHSNSWWGLLGWLVGAFTSGVLLMPLLWFLPLVGMFTIMLYTPVWGFATAKIINGIIIKTSWYPEGFGRVLIGLIVGSFVGTSFIIIDSYLVQQLNSPPVQLCIFIISMAAGIGSGIMSRAFDARPYN